MSAFSLLTRSGSPASDALGGAQLKKRIAAGAGLPINCLTIPQGPGRLGPLAGGENCHGWNGINFGKCTMHDLNQNLYIS